MIRLAKLFALAHWFGFAINYARHSGHLTGKLRCNRVQISLLNLKC